MHSTDPEEENGKLYYPNLDYQIGGGHYQKMKIQPMRFCLANMSDEELRGVMKYVNLKYHWRDKDDPIEDVDKAQHYVDMIQKELKHRKVRVSKESAENAPTPASDTYFEE